MLTHLCCWACLKWGGMCATKGHPWFRMYLWRSLCSMYWLACQVSFHRWSRSLLLRPWYLCDLSRAVPGVCWFCFISCFRLGDIQTVVGYVGFGGVKYSLLCQLFEACRVLAVFESLGKLICHFFKALKIWKKIIFQLRSLKVCEFWPFWPKWKAVNPWMRMTS